VLGRFVGKLLTAALGWASMPLLGRLQPDKRILLVLITSSSPCGNDSSAERGRGSGAATP
jgi:hypothetical protein